jgi:hypothetical protein
METGPITLDTFLPSVLPNDYENSKDYSIQLAEEANERGTMLVTLFHGMVMVAFPGDTAFDVRSRLWRLQHECDMAFYKTSTHQAQVDAYEKQHEVTNNG